MNEKTEQNINEAIDWLQKTKGSIQDFAVEQAPLYCREVVAWELWSGIIGTIAGLIFLVIAVVTLLPFRKNTNHMDEGQIMLRIFGGFVALVLGILIIPLTAPDTIKAAVAPRLVIVEHLRNLK